MHLDFRKLKLLRRKLYGLRIFVPWLRERHRLELMVGPLGYWNELQSYQLNVLKANGLQPQHKLLDIGCGPLQGGIAFIKYLEKGNYFGIDKNIDVIEAGKNQIKSNKLTAKNPYLACSENFELNEISDIKFDYMWASQILYYFEEEKIRSLMQMISLRLKDNGKFLGDIIGLKHYEFRLKEHNWILHSVESLKNQAKEYDLTVKNKGEIFQYSYPQKLSLSSNLLIEILKLK